MYKSLKIVQNVLSSCEKSPVMINGTQRLQSGTWEMITWQVILECPHLVFMYCQGYFYHFAGPAQVVPCHCALPLWSTTVSCHCALKPYPASVLALCPPIVPCHCILLLYPTTVPAWSCILPLCLATTVSCHCVLPLCPVTYISNATEWQGLITAILSRPLWEIL